MKKQSILAETKPTYFNVVKNEATREATIYIYGAIGGIDFNTWEEINTADKFAEEFRAVENEADTIHVRINSPGGYVFEGLAIYNTLIASAKKVITYNDGLCASMAALILLAGDEIHAFSNSLLMVHSSIGFYSGNKKQVEEALKVSDKIDKALGTAIENRLGISAEEVATDYLNYSDNWYTSDEAKEKGFYDTIIEKKKAQLPENVKSLNSLQMFQKYAAMSFEIPTENQKPNIMSNPNSYPNLEASLELSEPLATTDNGSFLNEDQKAALETKMATITAALDTANSAKEQAAQELQAAKDSHTAALALEKETTATALASLKAAAKLAGVEELAEDATMETIDAALTKKITALNMKPGDNHTTKGSDDPEPSEFAYLDLNSSIYQNK